MVEIYGFRYMVEMGCNLDLWKPSGVVHNHPNFSDGSRIFTSTPADFDEENLVLTTASGRMYKIMSFEGDREKWIAQIKEDIIRQGTEVVR